MLTVQAALALATACAPQASPSLLLSVAYAESHWDPLAIHDNRTGEAFDAGSTPEAVELAARLLAEGHRPDLGLLQISSANLGRTHLTLRTAFDPCASLRAGAQLLAENLPDSSGPKQQDAALLAALSQYNTGSRTAGLQSYVPRVLDAARIVIPVLGLAQPSTEIAPPPSPQCEPAGWHFSARVPACTAAAWHVSTGAAVAAAESPPGHLPKDPTQP